MAGQAPGRPGYRDKHNGSNLVPRRHHPDGWVGGGFECLDGNSTFVFNLLGYTSDFQVLKTRLIKHEGKR